MAGLSPCAPSTSSKKNAGFIRSLQAPHLRGFFMPAHTISVMHCGRRVSECRRLQYRSACLQGVAWWLLPDVQAQSGCSRMRSCGADPPAAGRLVSLALGWSGGGLHPGGQCWPRMLRHGCCRRGGDCGQEVMTALLVVVRRREGAASLVFGRLTGGRRDRGGRACGDGKDAIGLLRSCALYRALHSAQ